MRRQGGRDGEKNNLLVFTSYNSNYENIFQQLSMKSCHLGLADKRGGVGNDVRKKRKRGRKRLNCRKMIVQLGFSVQLGKRELTYSHTLYCDTLTDSPVY